MRKVLDQNTCERMCYKHHVLLAAFKDAHMPSNTAMCVHTCSKLAVKRILVFVAMLSSICQIQPAVPLRHAGQGSWGVVLRLIQGKKWYYKSIRIRIAMG